MSYSVSQLIGYLQYFSQHPTGVAVMRDEWKSRWTREQFRNWFWKCLDRKINQSDVRTGRKHTREYQQSLISDRYKMRHGLTDFITPELRKRFAKHNL